ncbi:hypothetical protein HY491_02175 [Candidatus Woesearchaeota archaeon]|nr:hypothetical protein [Candidatus Woesearchaeota archaeon]
MVTTAKLRAWGSSLGIIVPHEIVQKEKLSEGEEVFIDIKRKNKVKELFGSLKGWKIDSQKMKDELRKEWHK